MRGWGIPTVAVSLQLPPSCWSSYAIRAATSAPVLDGTKIAHLAINLPTKIGVVPTALHGDYFHTGYGAPSIAGASSHLCLPTTKRAGGIDYVGDLLSTSDRSGVGSP